MGGRERNGSGGCIWVEWMIHVACRGPLLCGVAMTICRGEGPSEVMVMRLRCQHLHLWGCAEVSMVSLLSLGAHWCRRGGG